MDFVGNLLLFLAVKNFENMLRINKVIAVSLAYYFFCDSVVPVVSNHYFYCVSVLRYFHF